MIACSFEYLYTHHKINHINVFVVANIFWVLRLGLRALVALFHFTFIATCEVYTIIIHYADDKLEALRH